MVLVSYQDSEDESVAEGHTSLVGPTSPKKRKRGESEEQPKASKLPPLPETFHSLYSTPTRAYPSDHPELHGGRRRQTPHVEGNWPTHVYLEWFPKSTTVELLQDIIDSANIDGQVHSLLRSELSAQLPLHVSLSAPLSLRTEQKSDFKDTLEHGIKMKGIEEVQTAVKGLRWERNYDGTRWFLVLRLVLLESCEGLKNLLDVCNECASAFELPLLYDRQDPSDAFHISTAWQLTAPSFVQRTVLAHPNVSKLQLQTGLLFQTVKLKIGNIVKDIPLRAALD